MLVNVVLLPSQPTWPVVVPDIKLGEGVRELGGLCVIGTERHESLCIDNQLRGRSGRTRRTQVTSQF